MSKGVWRAGSKRVQIPETEDYPAADVLVQCGNGDFTRKIARITAEAGNAYLATGLTPLRLASDRAELLEALQAALTTIEDYLDYDHNGDPWVEDARAMGEMDINDYKRDGRLDKARAVIAKAEGRT